MAEDSKTGEWIDFASLREELKANLVERLGGAPEVASAMEAARVNCSLSDKTVTIQQRTSYARGFVKLPLSVVDQAVKEVYGAEFKAVLAQAKRMSELEERVFLLGGSREFDWGKLAGFALEEDWGAGFRLLRNYVTNTFDYLFFQERDKIKRSSFGGGLMAFNTGLVDYAYNDIFFCAQKSSYQGKNAKPYEFVGFCTKDRVPSGDDINLKRRMREAFGGDLPGRAQYLKDVADAVYDPSLGEPELENVDHIILDNIDRFPKRLIIDSSRGDGELREAIAEGKWAEAKGIISHSEALATMVGRLRDAVSYAFKQVCWNYKTAVPSYYPARGKIQLLLPLSYDLEHRVVSNVLVVSRESEIYGGERRSVYKAYTVLSMQMAYNNARLIARPNSEWLTAQSALRAEPGEGDSARVE